MHHVTKFLHLARMRTNSSGDDSDACTSGWPWKWEGVTCLGCVLMALQSFSVMGAVLAMFLGVAIGFSTMGLTTALLTCTQLKWHKQQVVFPEPQFPIWEVQDETVADEVACVADFSMKNV